MRHDRQLVTSATPGLFLVSFTRLGLGLHRGYLALIPVLESMVYLSVTVDPGRLLALGSSARLPVASRTPVLGTVVRRRGGDAVEVQRGRCRPAGGDDVVGGHIPSLAAPLLIGLEFLCVWDGGSVEPRSPSPHPHLPFMCAVRQRPTNRIRVGLPRSWSRDRGPIGRWAYWWRSINKFLSLTS